MSPLVSSYAIKVKLTFTSAILTTKNFVSKKFYSCVSHHPENDSIIILYGLPFFTHIKTFPPSLMVKLWCRESLKIVQAHCNHGQKSSKGTLIKQKKKNIAILLFIQQGLSSCIFPGTMTASKLKDARKFKQELRGSTKVINIKLQSLKWFL